MGTFLVLGQMGHPARQAVSATGLTRDMASFHRPSNYRGANKANKWCPAHSKRSRGQWLLLIPFLGALLCEGFGSGPRSLCRPRECFQACF